MGVAVLVVVAGVLLAISVQQPVLAGGYQDGQSEAEQDFMRSNGQDKDPGCSPALAKRCRCYPLNTFSVYPVTISYGNGFSDLLDRSWCDGLNRIIPP